MFDSASNTNNNNHDDQPFSFENRRNSSSSNIFSQHFNPSSPTTAVNGMPSSNACIANTPTSTTPTFGTLKEIRRTAAHAWCPGTTISSPLIATGTLSGAMDLSFSTSAQLEISELNLDNKTTNEVITKACTPSHSRFNKLSWSSDGVIIGGLEDGSLNFWNVQTLLDGLSAGAESKDPLFTKNNCHKGPVRGLEVNLGQSNLVASGSSDQDIIILDLNKLSHEPYAPSPNRSNKLEEVTDLSWNLQVPYILAAVSNSGYGVMWDLRARKEVIHVATPPSTSASRTPLSCLSWNPDNAMHLLTASDDDSNPQIFSWDLRNARAPEKVLSGHKKGILSLSWNPKDSDLLLSSAKDQQVMCWNPRKGELLSDSLWSDSDNWLFDTQWCPQYPDIFSTSSFGDVIRVHSFQTLLSSSDSDYNGVSSSIAGTHSFPSNTSSSSNNTSNDNTTKTQSSQSTVSQIPKWLRRPVGVSFGPGGRLVTFSASSKNPSLHPLKDLITMGPLQKTLRDACLLDEALSCQKLSTFCERNDGTGTTVSSSSAAAPPPPSRLRGEDFDAVFWAVAKAIFATDDSVKYQDRMMNLLGFDKCGLEKRLRTLSNDCRERKRTRSLSGSQVLTTTMMTTTKSHSPPEQQQQFTSNHIDNTTPAPTVDDVFSGMDASFGDGFGDNFGVNVTTGNANTIAGGDIVAMSTTKNIQHPNNPCSPMKEFSLFNPSTTDEVDRLITRAIILGNFEAAVDLCVQSDRLSDALLVAVCGGPALVKKTQEDYFVRAPYPYLRLVSGIVKGDLGEVVEDASLEDWEELLAICCSFSPDSTTFQRLCSTLGHRLLVAKDEDPSYEEASVICFMAAGHVKMACTAMMSLLGASASASASFNSDLVALQSLVEKIRILEQIGHLLGASADVSTLEIGEVSGPFEQYAHFLSSFGLLPIADRYLSSVANGDRDAGDDGTLALSEMLTKMGIRAVSGGSNGFSDCLNIPVGVVSAANNTNTTAAAAAAAAATSNFSQPPQSAMMMSQGLLAPPVQLQQQPQQQSFMAPPAQIMVPSMNGTLPATAATSTSRVPLYKTAGNYNDAPIIPLKRTPVVQPIVQPVVQPVVVAAAAAVVAPPPPSAAAPLPPTPLSAAAPLPPPPPPSSLQQFAQASPLPPTTPSPQLQQQQRSSSPSKFAEAPSAVAQSPVAHAPPSPIAQFSQAPPPVFNSAPSPPLPLPLPIPQQTPQPQQQTPPQRSTSSSPLHATKIPFDESQLKGEDVGIHATWKALIEACKQRAMPMQKKIVEDSARKIDFLFLQLAASSGSSNGAQPLSDSVKDLLLQMTNALMQRNYDLAHQLHLPLMTSHFNECGKWILAVKRLIEISKMCLQ